MSHTLRFIHSNMNYYNEYDAKTAAWLKQLITDGLVPHGDVDTRSITEVTAGDLSGYTQCHFFAGIGGWSLALQLAGWPRGRPVWTGSCPCQPFSSAGKQKGAEDERHLWPAFFNLIRQCRPEHVFGEQVASAIGHGWLDGVSADLESEGYACGATVLGAHSVGAPHIRQRLYWVAHTDRSVGNFGSEKQERREAGGNVDRRDCEGAFRMADPISARKCGGDERGLGASGGEVGEPQDGKSATNESSNRCEDALRMAIPSNNGAGCITGEASGLRGESLDAGTESIRQTHGQGSTSGVDSRSSSCASGVEHPECGGLLGGSNSNGESTEARRQAESNNNREPSEGCADADRVANPQSSRCEGNELQPIRREWTEIGNESHASGSGATCHWNNYTLIPCRDGKSRRIESGTFPLVARLPKGMVYSSDPGEPINPQETAEARVMRLRGYGNAIVPQVASAFIQAFLESNESTQPIL